MKDGIIFNIQKFSVNDGPGIRTTVFLKGCPLHCAWCANPESQSIRPQLFHDEKKCVRCGLCGKVCPEHIELLNTNFSAAGCTGCKTCEENCPNDAVSVEGERMSVEKILAIVEQDRPFYEQSNGGMTLSGGELLAQPDFAKELLEMAERSGIDTCIETTGYGDQKLFKEILAHTDHIYMDVKHYDGRKHKQFTGVSNERILENLKTAIKSGIDLVVRIPVIPGFNDTIDDAKNFANLFNTVGVTRIQLLPFHQFGQNKYHLLNQEYRYEDTAALHPEQLEDYRQIFIDHGLEAFF